MLTPLIVFFIFLIYLFAGASVLQLNPARRLNQLFAAACASYCLWSIAYVLLHFPSVFEAGSIFYNISSFGSAFFVSFMLHFCFVLARRRKKAKAIIFIPALYLPSIAFLFLGTAQAPGAAGFRMLTLDRPEVFQEADSLFQSWALWHAAGTAACLLLIFSIKRKTDSDIERRHIKMLLSTGVNTLSLVVLATVILPLFHVKIPFLLPASFLIWVFGVWRFLAKQRVITLKDVNVSENILNTISESIILTATSGKIISANPAALDLSGYTGKELRTLEIKNILKRENGLSADILKEALLGKTFKNLNLFLKSKNGELIPVLAYTSPIINSGNELAGVSFILNDITEIKKTELLLRRNEEKYRDLWENAPLAYHLLDTSGRIKDVNIAEEKMLGYRRDEMLGKEIFDFIAPEQRGDSKKRFFEKLTGKPLPETQKRRYKRKDGANVFVSVHDAPQIDEKGKITGMRTTILDITKRVQAEEKLQEAYLQLEQSLEKMVLVIAKIVELRDPYTAGHGRKVAQLACKIAEKMGMSEGEINGIHLASIIHDIGKIYVPIEILSKPAKLSEIEFDIVKTHPDTAYEILKDVDFPWPIANIIRQHHERINGAGYPLGLKGDEILLEAKIIGVADVTESMISFRPYRSALGVKKAVEELQANRGILYDPEATDVCVKLFAEEGFKFEEQNEVNLYAR
jgi:PAS domain S-box-containing protein